MTLRSAVTKRAELHELGWGLRLPPVSDSLPSVVRTDLAHTGCRIWLLEVTPSAPSFVMHAP